MKHFSKTLKTLSKNLITLRSKTTIPQEGMGATMQVGSDCYPYTVVEVAHDLSYILVQPDNHNLGPNFDYYANQSYTYFPCPEAEIVKYTLRKNGRYMLAGAARRAYWCEIHVGHRRYYQDPSF